ASGIATVASWKLATAAGANTLTATASAGSVDFHATGTAGSVDHLVVTPANVSITTDDTQTYAVEGRDQFDNTLGDVTGSATLSVDGVPCIGSLCAAALIGTHTVSASLVGATGTATMHVA